MFSLSATIRHFTAPPPSLPQSPLPCWFTYMEWLLLSHDDLLCCSVSVIWPGVWWYRTLHYITRYSPLYPPLHFYCLSLLGIIPVACAAAIHLHSQRTARLISPQRSICHLVVNKAFAFDQMHLECLSPASFPTLTLICSLPLSALSLPTEDLRSVFTVFLQKGSFVF